MRSSARQSLCPSRFCAAANPVQALISKQRAEAVHEPAIEGAVHCSACGCVWVRDLRGRRHVLGALRPIGTQYRWISAYKLT